MNGMPLAKQILPVADSTSYIAFGMRPIYLVAILSLLIAHGARAQMARDVRSIALSGSEIADARTNVETNPAYSSSDSGATFLMRLTPTANYIDGAFEALAASSVPLGDLQLGGALDHLGFEDTYSFTEMSFGLSETLSREHSVVAGARIRYHIESYGPSLPVTTGLGLDIGTRVEPVDGVLLGADVLDLISAASTARAIDLGVAYRIDESELLASTRLEGDRFAFQFGADIPIAQSVTLRAGTSTSTHVLTAGVDFRYDSFHVDLGFQKHPDLGTALSFGLRWQDI